LKRIESSPNRCPNVLIGAKLHLLPQQTETKRVYSFQPFGRFSETSYIFDDPGNLF